MSKEEIKEFMHSKDFSEWCRAGDGSVITYMWDKGIDNGTSFACDVKIEDLSFTFRYTCGLTHLTQGPMSPISNVEHFRKMANHFYARVEALAKAFPRG